ncbi:MAG TPA: hypothetical protein VG165_00455 [Solirubrobacteraceae bacterium]|nr:hypothetical protein [Solirubrobacteraceae bacterium]
MTRKQADAAFESLRRHASAITAPTAPAAALGLLDRAVLTQLQRDAMVHYISVGPDNLALAYSVLKAGALTFAVAVFLAVDPTAEPPPGTDRAAERELFAERVIPLVDAIDRVEPTDRGRRLVDVFTSHVDAGRERLSSGSPPTGGEQPATGRAREAGDLFEAAGLAYVIAQLLESPSRPPAAVSG